MLTAHITLNTSFDTAIEQVTEALAKEGFGVITRIDMHETFAAKLGVAFRPFTILGACNPGLAHKAVSTTSEVGLLLPCNIVVEETPDGVQVLIPDAEKLLGDAGLEDSDALDALALDAGARLRRVADALPA